MPDAGEFSTVAVTERLSAALGPTYRIEKEMGGGGMSRTYLATDIRLGRRVVVKVLPPERASIVSAARFQREISVTALLQHPHILPILSAGTDGELLYFVTPFVDGESLRDRLATRARLPVDETLRLLREIADALAFAHAKGVVHRDVKPGNILLAQGHALLADFGVAQALAGSDTHEAHLAVSLGTPQYMAPEHLAGERAPDPRSDVYSVGIVAYEILAGILPFPGVSQREVLTAKLRDDPVRLQHHRSDVPRVVSDIVSRAMSRDPDARFASAAELRDAIDRAMLQFPTVHPRRRRWVIPAVALGAVVTAAGAFWFRQHDRPTLDRNLLAIAPFEVLGGAGDLGFWREGLMDLLAANLDGAGAVRTVSPSLVMRRWKGRHDPASLTTLGRTTGAAVGLLGRIVGAGRDSVRVTVSLIDIATGRSRGEIQHHDAIERIDRLGDSLAIGVLREIGRMQPGGALRRETSRVSGLPALKAYLQGEQHFRRAEWDSARASYGRAVALDSAFALALARIGRTYSWQRYGADSLARVFALRAGAHNRGLAPRESLLIVADSLRSVVYGYQRDPSYWRHARRLLRTLETAVARYPEDPEVWYALGDARFHFAIGPGLSATETQVLAAFDRAISLDSAYALAYIHAAELGFAAADPVHGVRYARAFLMLAPTDVSADGTRLGVRLLAPGRGEANLARRTLDTASADLLYHAYSAIRRATDSSEAAIAILRRMAEGRPARYGAFDAAFARTRLVHELSYRGHLREAASLAEARRTPVLADLAMLGAVHPDTANAVFASWARDGSRDGLLGTSLVVHAYPWWVARRDTAALIGAIRQAKARAIAAGGLAPFEEQTGLAYLALARGDSIDAMHRLMAIPDSLCPLCIPPRLTLAALQAARGEPRRALDVLGQRFTLLPSSSDVLIALERSRVAALIGDREAERSRAFAQRAWARGDPAARRLVGLR